MSRACECANMTKIGGEWLGVLIEHLYGLKYVLAASYRMGMGVEGRQWYFWTSRKGSSD